MSKLDTYLHDWAQINRIDLDQIVYAAEQAAINLADGRASRVMLCPGDGTLYRIVVVPTACEIDMSEQHAAPVDRQAYVLLAGERGRGYLWSPSFFEESYVGEKWAPDNGWTAKIMALFLNAMSQATLSAAAA